MDQDRPDEQLTRASGSLPPEGDETLAQAAAPPRVAGRAIPASIGEYRIVGILGEGGMGIVYEAEQPSPRRHVALKVVRGVELVDELRLKLFEREAATLARLDHPNIGKIYQSGRTEEGRHFFAMELVRGPDLAAWLAARPARPDRAEIELRLRLFRQIGDAVQYAHQRGVIHRDLKPSNIIVTEAGSQGAGSEARPALMAKILDFGLARITEEDVAATQVTEIGVIKGTLPYMAPEQARGEAGAIDVRTDVYALGVILYELLTGRRPYAIDAASLLASVRVICEQRPESLGTHWPASFRLDPDLATIVATALEKEPDRRYASAAAFSEDLGRFLASQPILARPPSTMYQLRKLVARRKPLFATIAAALLLLVVAAIGLSFLYLRAETNLARALEAEQLARREQVTAERTSDFLVELFEEANPERTRGETVTARAVLDAGARRVGEELADEPLMKARLTHTLGQVYLSLGLAGEAERLTEQALTLRRAELPAGDLDIAASLHQQARVLEAQGKPTEAKAAYREALGLYAAQGERGERGLIDALGNFGWMLGQFGEFGAADSAITRALALVEASRPVDEEQLLDLLNNQSTIRMDMGATDAALEILDRALPLSRRLYGDTHHETGNVVTNISVATSMAGRFDEAGTHAIEALRIYRAIYGEVHPKVARGLGNVGIYLAQAGKRAEAKPYFEGALEIMTKLHGPEHPVVGQSLMNLGLLKLESGDVPGAAANFERAIAIHEAVAPEGSPPLANSLYQLAVARQQSGKPAEARRLLGRVLAMDERMFGPESTEVADDLEAIVSVERELGNAAEAGRLEARMNAIRAQLQAQAAVPQG
jgi:serine/threonine protein kinase/Tfp pilus assembly protein PilF